MTLIDAALASSPDEDADSVVDVNTAFKKLMAQHGDRLSRFVYKHVGNATDAEDLAQQAFVEAYRAYETFRGDSKLSTWLYGIAMNLVRNHMSRAPSRVHRFEDESVLENTASSTACPRQQLEASELVRILDIELGELIPSMREALMMVSLDEMSYEEAAVALGIPVGTVRSRVSRARAHLRRRFQEEGATLPF